MFPQKTLKILRSHFSNRPFIYNFRARCIVPFTVAVVLYFSNISQDSCIIPPKSTLLPIHSIPYLTNSPRWKFTFTDQFYLITRIRIVLSLNDTHDGYSYYSNLDVYDEQCDLARKHQLTFCFQEVITSKSLTQLSNVIREKYNIARLFFIQNLQNCVPCTLVDTFCVRI